MAEDTNVELSDKHCREVAEKLLAELNQTREGIPIPGKPLTRNEGRAIQVQLGSPELRSVTAYLVTVVDVDGNPAAGSRRYWHRDVVEVCNKLRRFDLDKAVESADDQGYPVVTFSPSSSLQYELLDVTPGRDPGRYSCYAEAVQRLLQSGFSFLEIIDKGETELWCKHSSGRPTYAEDVAQWESPIHWLSRLRDRVVEYYQDLLQRNDFSIFK